LCRVIGVKPKRYYAWKKNGEATRRQKRRNELSQLIYKVFIDSRRTYGSRRVFEELKKQGVRVSKTSVEQIMREKKLAPKRTRKNKSTTDSKHQLPISENILDRNFKCERPNHVWVTDITYIETHEGWLYLTVFLDLFSRKIVGWSMSRSLSATLVSNAYRMGIARRGTQPELVHSDRGSQYASTEFRDILKGVCPQSMSRKANCWDNAVSESFWKTLKAELIYRETFRTREEARQAIFEYIEIFYNKRRLHSTLGYLSPEEFELKVQKAA
jgi:transposase InsO family protein